MYEREKVVARVDELPPILRGLAEESLRRGDLYAATDMPFEESLDSELVAQLRLVLSDPALKKEWVAFHQALSDASRKDAEAIMRGEHDHEL